jgi:hypothetical protein
VIILKGARIGRGTEAQPLAQPLAVQQSPGGVGSNHGWHSGLADGSKLFLSRLNKENKDKSQSQCGK